MEGAWSAAEGICCTMHRDSAQPRDKVLVRRDAVKRPVQLEENVLRHFFGSSTVAEHTVRDAVDPRLMGLDNLTKLAGDPWHSASDLLPYSHIRETTPAGMQFARFIFEPDEARDRREGNGGPVGAEGIKRCKGRTRQFLELALKFF